MSKYIATSAISGAHYFVKKADNFLNQVIQKKGENEKVSFPDTVYYLPIIYSMLGKKVSKIGEIREVLEYCKTLLPEIPKDKTWLPYLGGTLDAGMATLFAQEIIEALKYVVGPSPVDGIWLGAASDVIIRERGIEFVDGTAPGFAAVVGAAPDVETAVKIARQLQEKMLYVFIAGHTGGISFAEQLVKGGVELGWHTRLVPLGKDISAAVYALGFANRAALSFGGITPGDYNKNLLYNKNKVFAFVMALGEVDEEKYATAAGAINYGFPVIADTDIPQILPTGICTYEHVVSNISCDEIVEKSLEVRGCKVNVTKVSIPVAYGAAFQGERIRKGEFQVQFGGNKSPAFEFLKALEMDEVEDGKVEVIGPDIDQVEVGASVPLGILIDVAGRKMQVDFESVLERQIHHLLNDAEGIWHNGQRDILWMRISKGAYEKGFRLKHLGEIFYAKLRADYPSIVDKVQITILTKEEDVWAQQEKARAVYVERNQRLLSMTDESVDTFYSCTLCQSFAPTHVCIISPQRLGLCGAYSWLDGKASYEIDPTGPNRPIKKGNLIDARLGLFGGINKYLYSASAQSIDKVSMYSILEHPMTSCGCFEAIVGIVPECNGFMVVNREYTGPTPCGMTFSELAGMVGGGQQVEGFLGVGKVYLSSEKFIKAEGGAKRIVWMPKELKAQIENDFRRNCERENITDLFDKIADETITTDPMELMEYLAEVDHYALKMDSII